MAPHKAGNERDALQGQLRLHRALNLGQAAALLVAVLLLAFLVVRDPVRIVPPEVRRPYEIGAGRADRDYLSDMAGYVLGMVLTVTPESVDYNNRVILKMADPDGYGPLKAALDGAALRLKQERVATVWIPRREEISERQLRVKVSGSLRTYIADRLTSERDKDYVVDFAITTSGRLYVAKIEEIIKRDPA